MDSAKQKAAEYMVSMLRHKHAPLTVHPRYGLTTTLRRPELYTEEVKLEANMVLPTDRFTFLQSIECAKPFSLCIGAQTALGTFRSTPCKEKNVIKLYLPVSAIDYHVFRLAGLEEGDTIEVVAGAVPELLIPHAFDIVIDRKPFKVMSGMIARADLEFPEFLPMITSTSRSDGTLAKASRYNFGSRLVLTNEEVARLHTLKSVRSTFEESYTIDEAHKLSEFATHGHWPVFTSKVAVEPNKLVALLSVTHVLNAVQCDFPFTVRLTDDVVIQSTLLHSAGPYRVIGPFPCLAEVVLIHVCAPDERTLQKAEKTVDQEREDETPGTVDIRRVNVTIEQEFVPEWHRPRLAEFAVAAASSEVCIVTKPDEIHTRKRCFKLAREFGKDFGLSNRLASLRNASASK